MGKSTSRNSRIDLQWFRRRNRRTQRAQLERTLSVEGLEQRQLLVADLMDEEVFLANDGSMVSAPSGLNELADQSMADNFLFTSMLEQIEEQSLSPYDGSETPWGPPPESSFDPEFPVSSPDPYGGDPYGGDPYGGAGFDWSYELTSGSELFHWPDSPNRDGGPQRPANTPGEPARPSTGGPELVYEADSQYLDDISTASSAATQARLVVQQTYSGGKNTLDATLSGANAAAGSQHSVTLQSASDAYTAALNGTSPYDLEGAALDQQDAIEQAESSYQETVDAIDLVDYNASMQAMTTYWNAVDAAEQARQAAIDAAYEAYSNSDPYGGGGDDALRDAIAVANYNYSVAIANADYNLSLASNVSNKVREDGMAEAEKVRRQAINLAIHDYGVVVSNHQFWESNHKVVAKKEYEIAKANATKTYEIAVATATKDHEIGIANLVHQRDSSLIGISRDQVIANANASLASAQRWAAVLNDPWSAYLLQTEQIYHARVLAVANAIATGQDSAAAAIKTESIGKANAKHAKTVAIATVKQTRDVGKADAEALRAGGTGAVEHAIRLSRLSDKQTRDDSIAISQAIERKQKATATKTYHDAQALIFRDHTITVAGITRAFETESISQTERDAQFAAAFTARQQALLGPLQAYKDSNDAAEKTRYQSDLDAEVVWIKSEIGREKQLTDGNADRVDGIAVTLATLDSNFRESQAGSENIEQVAIVRAEVDRVSAVGTADVLLAQSTAVAYQSEADALARARALFLIGQANAHVHAVSAWAAANPSPYSSFRAALATIERDRISLIENAHVTRITAGSLAYVQSTVGSASALVTNLVAHANADLAGTQSVATANALMNSSVTVAMVSAATDISGAIKTYDKAVSLANKTASEADNDSQKEKNRAIHFAQLDFAITVAIASFKLSSLLISAAAYTAIVDGAYLTLRTETADAEGAYTIAAANIRKNNTAAVGASKTALTAAMGSAMTARTSAASVAERTYEDAVAEAGNTTAVAQASAHKSYRDTLTSMVSTYNASNVSIDQTYLRAVNQADADAAKAIGTAHAHHASDRAQEYASLVAAWALQTGTLHSQYLADVAQAEADWADANTPIFIAAVDSQSDAELTAALGIIDSAAARMLAEDTAMVQYVNELSTHELTRAQGIADAAQQRLSELAIAHQSQKNTIAGSSEQYNNQLAGATESFENAVAIAGVAYVNATVPLKKQWYIAGETSAATAIYEAAEEQLRLIKYQATGSANVTLQQARGDAEVAWRQSVGDADVAASMVSAAAAKAMYATLQIAENGNATANRTSHAALTSAHAAAQQTYTNSVFSILEAEVDQIGTTSVAHAGASGANHVQFADDVAVAESTLRISEANSAANAAAQTAVQTNLQSDQYRAAVAAAHRDYIVAYAPKFEGFQRTVAEATAEHSHADATARQSRNNASAVIVKQAAGADAVAAKARLIAMASAAGDYSVAGTAAQETHKASVAQSREAAVGPKAQATRDYEVAMAAAKRDYEVAWATIWVAQNGPNPPDTAAISAMQVAREAAKTAAEADAQRNRTIAEANWGATGTTATASADHTFRIAESLAFLGKQQASADAEKLFRHSVADSEQIRLNADATNEAWLAKELAIARKAYLVTTANAESNAMIEDANITAALVQGLANQFPSDWLDYYADYTATIATFISNSGTHYVNRQTEIGEHAVTYADELGQSYVLLTGIYATALNTESKAKADLHRDQDFHRASAANTYITTTAPAAKAESIAVANSQLAFEIALANAEYDYQVSGDLNAKNLAVAEASNQRSQSNTQATETRSQVFQSAFEFFAAQNTLIALDQEIGNANVEHALNMSGSAAARDYLVARADAVETVTVSDARSIRDYIVGVANAYLAAMQSLASSNGSNWAQADANHAAIVIPQIIADQNSAYNQAVNSAAASEVSTLNQIQLDYQDDVDAINAERDSRIDYANMMFDDAMWMIVNTPWAISISPPTLIVPARSDSFIHFSNFAALENVPDWFESLNGARMTGPTGDGFYTSIVSSMLVSPSAPNDGYGWAYQRWIGEGLIRPILGDEWLVNASDAQLWGVTLLYAVPAGIVIYGSGGTILLYGAGFGLVYGLGDQLIDTYWYHDQTYLNWDFIGATTVGGALIGPLMKIPVVNLALAAAMTYSFAENAYSEWKQGRYVAAAYEAIWAGASLFATARLARSHYTAIRTWSRSLVEYPGCFVEGTVVVMGQGYDHLDAYESTPDASWSPLLVCLAGMTVPIGLVGKSALQRKVVRRKKGLTTVSARDDARDAALRDFEINDCVDLQWMFA